MDQIQGIEIEVIDFDEYLAEKNMAENDFLDNNEEGIGGLDE